MNEVLHANIFFVIASIATVLFFIGVSLVLWQVYKIVRLIRSIVERIESASEVVADDVAHVREFISSGKGFIPSIIGIIFGKMSKKK